MGGNIYAQFKAMNFFANQQTNLDTFQRDLILQFRLIHFIFFVLSWSKADCFTRKFMKINDLYYIW